MTQLSQNFSLAEMTKTQVRGVNNKPTAAQVKRLTLLCENILEPVRKHYRKPVVVNSGYRCLEVNRAIGSKDTSQHVQAQAVDFEVPTISNYDLAVWCRDNLDYDQLILEHHDRKIPDSGWCHASWTGSNHRKSVLTINKKGNTKAGI